MSRLEALTKLLIASGAGETRHSGRTLLDHLLGTYRLLKDAGCEDAVCLAGAAHSVYGTNAFCKITIPHSMRHGLVKIIGPRAELLAWKFHSLDRPKAIEDGQSRDLMLIEAANLIEQGGSLSRYPNIAAAWANQTKKETA